MKNEYGLEVNYNLLDYNFVTDGSSSSSDANNFNFDATDFPEIKSFVLPYYNLQFNSQNVQFSMKPLHSMHVVPFAFGLSTFCEYFCLSLPKSYQSKVY